MSLKSIDSVTIPRWPFIGLDPAKLSVATDLKRCSLRVQVFADQIAIPVYLAIIANAEQVSRNCFYDPPAAQLVALNLATQLRQDLRILWRKSSEAGPGAPTWHGAFTTAVLEHGVFRTGTVPDACKFLADLIHPYLIGRHFEYKFPHPTESGRLVTEPCEIKWEEQHLLDYVFMPDGRVFDKKGNLIGQLKRDEIRRVGL